MRIQIPTEITSGTRTCATQDVDFQICRNMYNDLYHCATAAVENYRLILLLPIFAKVFEKVLFPILCNCLTKYPRYLNLTQTSIKLAMEETKANQTKKGRVEIQQ